MASLSWTSVGLVLSPFQLQHAPAVLKPGGWVLGLSIPSGAEPKRHPSAEDANIMQCPHHLVLDHAGFKGNSRKLPTNRGSAKLNKP